MKDVTTDERPSDAKTGVFFYVPLLFFCFMMM